jgi:hypothetical protein
MIALHYRWSPDSWDGMPLTRFVRVLDAHADLVKQQKDAMSRQDE